MRKLIFNIIGLVTLASLIISCDNAESLQQFIVNQQERTDIISFDLPASMLSLNEQIQTPEDKATLKTIKKATILANKITDKNQETNKKEMAQLKKIFKQDKYSELMRFGKGSKGAKVMMVGKDDKIDELIIFGNDNELGWILVRILGDDMQPEKIMKLADKVDFDTDNMDFSKLTDIFKEHDNK